MDKKFHDLKVENLTSTGGDVFLDGTKLKGVRNVEILNEFGNAVIAKLTMVVNKVNPSTEGDDSG